MSTIPPSAWGASDPPLSDSEAASQVGALTFVQRADSVLRLNVHFHTLALDGLYTRVEEGEVQFRELGAPTTEDVAQVAAWTHASLLRVLKRHGRSPDERLLTRTAYDLLLGESLQVWESVRMIPHESKGRVVSIKLAGATLPRRRVFAYAVGFSLRAIQNCAGA